MISAHFDRATPRERRRWGLRSAACVVIALVSGCAMDRALEVELPDGVRRPSRSVVVFFIDGLGQRELDQAMSEGRLPHIQRHLYERGVQVKHAVSCIPSITYPNAVTFITGMTPGHHGVISNKWFDPQAARYQDYRSISTYRQVDEDYPDTPTLYELAPELYTVSLQAAQRRGVDMTIDNWATSGINWYFGNFSGVDCLVAQDFELIARRSGKPGQWPDFVMAYFPGVDQAGHRAGPRSNAYRLAVSNVDLQIGRICDALTDLDVYDRTVLCLVSDHGTAEVQPDQYFDVKEFLASKTGRPVWSKVCNDERTRRRMLRDHVYASAACGSRWAALYGIRGGADDEENALIRLPVALTAAEVGLRESGRPSTDVLEAAPSWFWEMAYHPAVALVACRSTGGRVHLFRGRAHGIIERTSMAPRSYRLWQRPGAAVVPATACPPGAESPAGAESRAWLAASAASEFPDLIPQIVELFDSPRAGDVVLFASEGWDFSADDPQGGHGSVLAADMSVPMIFSGPGVPIEKTIDYARNCDLMPTVMGLLGKSEAVGEVDGVDLFGGVDLSGGEPAAISR